MHGVAVPRLNGNDDTCRLVEWACADGAAVTAQATVAVVETSKAAADIPSEHAGVLQSVAAVGTECRVGEVIGYVFADEAARQEFLRQRPAGGPAEPAAGPADAGSAEPLVLTAPARRLSEQAGLTAEQLRSLGKRLVREADVEELVRRSGPAPAAALSPRQRAIAAVVGRSHRTVPDAYAAVEVPCDGLLDRLRDWNAERGSAVGVPEVLVTVLAGLRPEFGDFFGWLEDDQLVRPGPQTDIGVTVDVGTGLFVPVVRDAAALGLAEVADRLMEFRYRALRGSFREADLAGGQLSLSLAMDEGVLLTLPIVLAPQVAMVSVGAVRTGLELDGDGRPRPARRLTLGLTYDHRAVNGRDAVRFLTAVRAALGRPEEVVR